VEEVSLLRRRMSSSRDLCWPVLTFLLFLMVHLEVLPLSKVLSDDMDEKKRV